MNDDLIFENFPDSASCIRIGNYKLGNQTIKINNPKSISKGKNQIFEGTRISDLKTVIIKYRERERKREGIEVVEKNILSEFSYHPNLVSLLGSPKDNIVVLEKGFKFQDAKQYYFGGIGFNDELNLLKSLFCQYAVFLSFGHHRQIYQKDVKPENTIIFPSIYYDQPPHLKLIDFELSSFEKIASTVLLPFDNEQCSIFFESNKRKTYHSHLLDSYYMCLPFNSLNNIHKLGFKEITENDIKEIKELLLSSENITLYEIIETCFIQDRLINFYNLMPNDKHSHEHIKVRDIIKRIDEIKTNGKSQIYIRYLSTPHIFDQSWISHNNILFPYYSISSVYIVPNEDGLYENNQNIDKLKNIVGELILNIKFLSIQEEEIIPHTYSYMSENYLDRYNKKKDLENGYSDIKDFVGTQGLTELIKQFKDSMKNYHINVLNKRNYYTKIKENNINFEQTNINHMNKSFQVMEEAIKMINKDTKNEAKSKSIIEFNCLPFQDCNQEILNKEYFKAENHCLEIMEEFLDIGNILSKKNAGINFEGILKRAVDKKNSMIYNSDIDKLQIDIKNVKNEIELLEVVYKYFSSNKINNPKDEINFPDCYKEILKKNNESRNKIRKINKETMEIVNKLKENTSKLQEMKNDSKINGFKSHQLNQNNNGNGI